MWASWRREHREQRRRIARLVEAAAVGVAFTLKITPLTVLTCRLVTAWQEVCCSGEEMKQSSSAARADAFKTNVLSIQARLALWFQVYF